MAGLPPDEIEQDFASGAGQELDEKFCAAHSSAALVVNTFGPWRTAAESLTFAGITGFRSARLSTCPTGLGGTPPHLDPLADGDVPVAVESKCTEWLEANQAVFADSYQQLRAASGRSPWTPWFEQMLQLQGQHQFFDAAQIIKHAFGLLRRHGTRDVRLVYLFWENSELQNNPISNPQNAISCATCRYFGSPRRNANPCRGPRGRRGRSVRDHPRHGAHAVRGFAVRSLNVCGRGTRFAPRRAWTLFGIDTARRSWISTARR